MNHSGKRAAAEADVSAGLKLRHDHGSNYMAEDFQREIAFLGMEVSPSFVRQRRRINGQAATSHAAIKTESTISGVAALIDPVQIPQYELAPPISDQFVGRRAE